MKSKIQTALITGSVLVMTSLPAFAEGTANSAVTSAFTGMKDDVIATLGPIGTVAITIAGIFMAWKYGRKIFSTVAK